MDGNAVKQFTKAISENTYAMPGKHANCLTDQSLFLHSDSETIISHREELQSDKKLPFR